MPFACSSGEYRELVLDQIRAGRPVAELVRSLSGAIPGEMLAPLLHDLGACVEEV